MSYYFIANYDVTDPKMYEQFIQAVRPTLMQFGAEILIANSEPNNIEGESRRTLVVLEFESEEATMKWYNSPEYQAIIDLRLNATEGWSRGAPQFVMPA